MARHSFNTPDGILDVETTWRGRERVYARNVLLSEQSGVWDLLKIHRFEVPAKEGGVARYEVRHLDPVGWAVKRDGVTVARRGSRFVRGFSAFALCYFVLAGAFELLGIGVDRVIVLTGGTPPSMPLDTTIPEFGELVGQLASVPAAFPVARWLRRQVEGD